MNAVITSEILTRPPKSPATTTSLVGSNKKVMTSSNSNAVHPPPLPPPRLQRSLSAPLNKVVTIEPIQQQPVKIYDANRCDEHDDGINLAWLADALESTYAEEKKEESSGSDSSNSGDSKIRRHRRARAFSWDGAGLAKAEPVSTKKMVSPPPTPATLPLTPGSVATDSSSSPETSPEPQVIVSHNWSLKPKAIINSQSRRGKPPKARSTKSPPLFRSQSARKMESPAGSSKRYGKNGAIHRLRPKPQAMSRGDVHEQVSSCLKNGDYDTALSLSENILLEDQRRYGHHHASVGIALHNIGMVHMHASRYEMAEATFYQAVLVRKNALCPEHLDVAASLTKLATVRLSLRRFEEALSAFLEAIRITRRHTGYCNSLIAQLQSHIGCTYYEVGEYIAAQATFEDALDVYKGLWAAGIDVETSSVSVTEMLCNIGSIQAKRKKYYEAVTSFSEALELQRRLMGPTHSRVIATLDNLGHAHSKNKDYDQALKCFDEMLKAQSELFGPYHDECYRTVKKQNVLFEKLKRRQSATSQSSFGVVSVTPESSVGDH